MKKILLGTAAGLFLTAANADCGCCDTSFSGVFLGASVDFSFDQAKVGSDVYAAGALIADAHYATTKKNKTAFGGSVILGYTYQFCNGLTLGVSHESSFASKAKATFDDIFASHDADNSVRLESTRKVYSPAFYINLGYVVDNWHFGIMNGVSIERFEVERGVYEDQDFAKYNKSFSQTSYVLGAFVEYKINAVSVFANVKYNFGHNKTLSVFNTTNMASQRITHKRPSWKLALGVKCNVNNLIH